jgi:ABC-type multidrug transport system ATPase subunit
MTDFRVRGFRKQFGRRRSSTVTIDDCVFQGTAALWLRGPNGSGKTTLLRAVAGWIVVFDGSIEFDGTSVRDLWRVGTVALLPTAEIFPPGRPFVAIRDRLADAWGVRRGDFASRVRNEAAALGAESLLGGRSGDWSTGEQKKVELATFFALDTPVQLLDEPFSGLDERAVKLLGRRILEAVRTGKTILFTDHKRSFESHGVGDVAPLDISGNG